MFLSVSLHDGLYIHHRTGPSFLVSFLTITLAQSMWAYKSYNDDAPAHLGPRFPSPKEGNDGINGAFSWSSLYKRGKFNMGIAKLPGKSIASVLHRPKSRSRHHSRRASFASSLLSRRSEPDERLDRIIAILELLAQDKMGNRTASITSSKNSRRLREISQLHDDSSEEDGPGGHSRPRSSGQSTYSRLGIISRVAGTGLAAAMQSWRDPSDGKSGNLKNRLKSSVKAGVKEAGKSSFKEANKYITGRRPKTRTMSFRSSESNEEENELDAEILAHTPKRQSAMDNYLLMKGDKDRHTRFKQEVLGMMDDSPGLNEDLLNGLLPPAQGYDLNRFPKPPGNHTARRPSREGKSKVAHAESEGSSRRPLHFDPSLPNVQSFSWPDVDEIAGHVPIGKTDPISHGMERQLAISTSHQNRSPGTLPRESTDREEAIRQMLRSRRSRGRDRSTEAFLGRAPSSLKLTSREKSINGTAEGTGVPVNGPDAEFGIVWPSTPSHEPHDSRQDETLPEYVSPATEAFNLTQTCIRDPTSVFLAAPSSEDKTPKMEMDGILFARVISKMASCLGKCQLSCSFPSADILIDRAKALAQKQHQYQDDQLSNSPESMVLRSLGSWLMRQISPLERAGALFAFAESDCMFGFLEDLIRMDGLLAHPVLQRRRWDPDVYEHLQAETESLQTCEFSSRVRHLC